MMAIKDFSGVSNERNLIARLEVGPKIANSEVCLNLILEPVT